MGCSNSTEFSRGVLRMVVDASGREWMRVDESGWGSTESTHGRKTTTGHEKCTPDRDHQDIDPRTRCGACVCMCGGVVGPPSCTLLSALA